MKPHAALAFLPLMLLLGCIAGPDYRRPSTPDEAAYVVPDDPTVAAAVGGDQRFLRGGTAPAGWWQWFGSSSLDALVARGFEGNLTLEAARARLRGARATLAARRGLRAPELIGDASASYGQGRGAGGTAAAFDGGVGDDGGTGPTGTGEGNSSGADDGTGEETGGGTDLATGGTGRDDAYEVYTAGATVTYDLDLAGRNRRLVEAAGAELERQRQELQAAYLAVAGNIVSTALELAALRDQIDAREALIASQEDRIDLIRVRVEEGASARADLVTALADVAALRATVPPLRTQLSQTENALARLTGRPPADAGSFRITLAELNLPDDVPIALPSRLVRTRPDVLASESLLRRASAEIGVAAADLYPNLTLDAGFGVGGTGGALDSFWSVGGGLFAPIFDGGRRRAERDVAVAAYEEALALYRDRVLAAFTEVADGIRALENDAVSLAAQEVALDAASESYDLALFRLNEGAISPIEVSVVQQRYEEARFAYIDALAQRFQDTARLLAALGPGPVDEVRLAADEDRRHLAATREALNDGENPVSLVSER
ncbi:efflux transporter outer membrane subunit [Parvularcula dongshanensis]|uniref:NodT family efflux transporter outer membrane factor (OMF) lipoprotein n=1 Tax=Parvularcula dongshanensis TaxID=1173995 RepID=A0A840HXJ2_9PROT|nr:efflux transporter outer membrane subunit [Parvularcula dongshanensis]MBB4657546.1 NodT family efflux transporter outer membrane factor (OMF) lipoprotein [Parvularcula dongshanensis]